MKSHSFFVENLKCGGCANTIQKTISKFTSVQDVTIDSEHSLVTIDMDDTKDELQKIKQKMAKIGYPEMGQNSLTASAISYVSCAIGRIGV